MSGFLIAIFTQSLTFIPLAFGISVSYQLLRATDMTIDGSFVIGAGVFARLVTLGFPPIIALVSALCAGMLAGAMTAAIQRGGKVDPLLAGVLATFILTSLNLIIMSRPNISLLSTPTLVSSAFASSDLMGWSTVAIFIFIICGAAFMLLQTRFGLLLRAFGDNALLLKRHGRHIEFYRFAGFGLSNLLAAAAGCFTAQTIGYADIGMGFGMTLTGIGTIILGQQILRKISMRQYFRVGLDFLSCLIGVTLYFFALNLLLRLDVDPIYLKMILGIILIIFLRSAVKLSGPLS
jgi:putative ABC transport system permease protein